MIIIGIETSCDETAAAVVKDGREILSNVVLSQVDIHREFGGVVPEVAARSHIEAILPVVEKALAEAFPTGVRSQESGAGNTKSVIRHPNSDDLWPQVDAIAVTYGPGLPGALLVGTLTARALAWVKNKPLYAIDHVEAHMYANFLTEVDRSPELGARSTKNQKRNPSSGIRTPEFPILALIVSGGHSQLVLFRDHNDYTVLGQTTDDAAGEAFDKVAKLLGLGYPGGPAIAQAAQRGDPEAYRFTKATLQHPYNFSFSGLKTAVLRQAQQLAGKDFSFPSHQLAPLLSQTQINNLAASFQHTAVAMMVDATAAAYREYQPQTVVIAGGVAANQELRRQLQKALPITIRYAPPRLCTDNASMIASCAYFESQANKPINPLELEHNPSLSMQTRHQ